MSKLLCLGQKKILLFPEMRVTTKIFLLAAANFFFNRFSGDIFFSCLVSLAFFHSCFFCLFVRCFLKLKMYILIQIWLCGKVNDKKILPSRFPETRIYFFLALAWNANFFFSFHAIGYEKIISYIMVKNIREIL